MDGSAPYTYTSIPPGPTPGAFSCDRSNLNPQKYVDMSQIVTGGIVHLTTQLVALTWLYLFIPIPKN